MKYKLINRKTNEEHICSKVTIDKCDYYLIDGKVNSKDWYFYNNSIRQHVAPKGYSTKEFKK